MSYKARRTDAILQAGPLVLIAAVMALTLAGCSGAPTGNANSNANVTANTNLNANTGAATPTGATPFSSREPERYSARMTLTARGTLNNQQRSTPELQFEFARLGNDKRWAFNLPSIGEVTYLEKAGLKYLIIPSRSQYVELRSEELGFNLPDLMTPSAAIDQLKSRTQYETLGTESINGRTATKYRFAGAANTGTQAGTVQADSFVYVDQDTGLPLRSEIYTSTTSGANATIVTETRDIQLNPDPAQFEVPATMRKVTTQELKQQVQNFVGAIRIFAEFMRQQGGAPPPAGGQPAATPANANRPATNTNANRP
jgi:hypothetical protein